MRIKANNKLTAPIDVPATSFVIYDNMNNPLVVGVQIDERTQIISKLGDHDFQEILQQYGFTRSVTVIDMIGKPLHTLW